MNAFPEQSFSLDDPELVSVIDEFPLWSAPFGMALLERHGHAESFFDQACLSRPLERRRGQRRYPVDFQ